MSASVSESGVGADREAGGDRQQQPLGPDVQDERQAERRPRSERSRSSQPLGHRVRRPPSRAPQREDGEDDQRQADDDLDAADGRVGLPWQARGRHAWASSVLSATTTKSPMTQPIRNGSAERDRFGDSRMKIVAMIGTELSATATANGRMWPIACTSLPSRR